MRATTGWSQALVGGYLVDVRWPDSGWGDAPTPRWAVQIGLAELMAAQDDWVSMLFQTAMRVP